MIFLKWMKFNANFQGLLRQNCEWNYLLSLKKTFFAITATFLDWLIVNWILRLDDRKVHTRIFLKKSHVSKSMRFQKIIQYETLFEQPMDLLILLQCTTLSKMYLTMWIFHRWINIQQLSNSLTETLVKHSLHWFRSKKMNIIIYFTSETTNRL